MSLITFEGIDRCGKTTIINQLKHRLKNTKYFQDPSPEIAGGYLRKLILENEVSRRTHFLLYLAARAELTHKEILPALNDGYDVICDRYYDSTTVYQRFYGLLDPYFSNWDEINWFASYGVIPDLTFVVDIPAKISWERGNPKDGYELSTNAFLDSIRNFYLSLAKTSARFCIIDGNRGIDEIIDEVLYNIKKRTELKVVK